MEWKLGTAVTAVALTATLAACGGSSGSPTVATTHPRTPLEVVDAKAKTMPDTFAEFCKLLGLVPDWAGGAARQMIVDTAEGSPIQKATGLTSTELADALIAWCATNKWQG